VNEQSADHDACSAFASFAVDSNNVLRRGVQPMSRVDAKLADKVEIGRVVVIEREFPDFTGEDIIVVAALAAEIVNNVVGAVTLVEKLPDVAEIIPIERFKALGRIAHRNNTLVDI
jgi:hypothetical protein